MFMAKYSAKYLQIEPKHKQVYFVSNILKGLMLGLFSINAYNILKNYYNYNIWNKKDIKYLGGIYSSLDLISMFKVEKMQYNTVIHHSMVQILYLIGLIFLDFNPNTVANGIVIYAIFSTFSFIVNIYLALRLILFDKFYIKLLASISSLIYQVSCAFNWSYQVYFLYSSNIHLFIKFLYIIVLSSIIFDDIVLIKFLNTNSFLN